MSAFDDLQRQLQKAKDKVRKRAAEAVDAIASLAKENEYRRAVTKKAESMQSLLADPRHADMREFLITLRDANRNALCVSAAQAGNAHDMLLTLARYGAKIELINTILEHPERCVSELKRLEKESADGK